MGETSMLLCLIVAAYVAGSVNFAVLVFRITGRSDPRRHGSGNPGATNVYRQAGPRWAAVVLLLDMGRAMAVAAAARWLLALPLVPWIGLGLIAGNRFPCFHGFKGGKGVANYLGFTLVLAPPWAVAGGLAWGAAFRLWRTPFLASFALVFVLTVGTIATIGLIPSSVLATLATALFIVACHHRNIRQYGSENRS